MLTGVSWNTGNGRLESRGRSSPFLAGFFSKWTGYFHLQNVKYFQTHKEAVRFHSASDRHRQHTAAGRRPCTAGAFLWCSIPSPAFPSHCTRHSMAFGLPWESEKAESRNPCICRPLRWNRPDSSCFCVFMRKDGTPHPALQPAITACQPVRRTRERTPWEGKRKNRHPRGASVLLH